MGKLFGTDGVRGIANLELTPELAFKIGRTAGDILSNKDKGIVVVGKDTRISGDMLEAALCAGLASMGLNVMQLGIIPTPAVAYLIRKYNAIAGVVISASHNPGEYNGIKIFNNKGLKLSDAIEEKIEDIIKNDKEILDRPIKEHIGRVYINEDGKRDYIDFLKSTISVDLSGMKIAMDCGNGALFEIGPIVLKELGADVEAINITPDGMNINKACGSTKPELVQKLVAGIGADLGVAFDGDADRVIAVDEMGNIINGDHILAICGRHLKNKGKLHKDKVVGTVMTNIGLDIFLKENGLSIEKTDVGDRYVLEKMLEGGYTLGGEQSGHIIFLEHNTTGDGMATALQILEIMKETKSKASELNSIMSDYPQVLVNARVQNQLKTKYMEIPEIKAEILKIEDMFHGEGRVLVRPSGTEPLVRVMIEGKNQSFINQKAIELANLIESKIGIK